MKKFITLLFATIMIVILTQVPSSQAADVPGQCQGALFTSDKAIVTEMGSVPPHPSWGDYLREVSPGEFDFVVEIPNDVASCYVQIFRNNQPISEQKIVRKEGDVFRPVRFTGLPKYQDPTGGGPR
jgi:hypothetical protein